MHELLWITILCHEWGDLPKTFTSEEVTSKNYCANRITSDPKIVIHGNECIFYFLYAILCPEHTISLKQLLITDFAIVAKDGLFWQWLSIVTSP